MLHGRYGMRLDGIYLRTASTKKEEHTLIRQFIRSAVQQQTRILLRRQKEEHCIGGWRASFFQPSSAGGFLPEIRLAGSGSNWTQIVIILQPALQGAGKISWLDHITPSGKSDCELKSTKVAVLGMIRKMTPDHQFHCIVYYQRRRKTFTIYQKVPPCPQYMRSR